MNEDLPVTEAELQAYVDERLPEERRAAVEAWLGARPEEAERIAAYRRLSREVRSAYDGLLDETIPDRLAFRAARRRRLVGAVAMTAALLAGVAVGTIAGWRLHGEDTVTVVAPPDGAALIARRAAIAHATYSSEVRHPVEVSADEEPHLVAWLSKRVGVKVRAPRLDEAGLSLMGGRLLPGENGQVAQFMYQSQSGRRLTLYLRAENARNRQTAFRYARENNVGVFYWIDREVGYALASGDLSKAELLRVATLVYKQLEP